MNGRVATFLTVIIGAVALAGGSAAALAQAAAGDQSGASQVEEIANGSPCASVNWKGRGLAPKAYIRGISLVFARAVCHLDRPDVKIASAKEGTPGSAADRTDALAWYHTQFADLGMKNDADGVDTLRHAYVLMIGLGMRESSGEYCTGRDASANFTSADSAEAGIFQTSWGVNTVSPILADMFHHYQSDPSGCFLDVFKEHVSCSSHDARTWGQGTGADWQQLTKKCPAFSTEYASVILRKSGGTRGEYGPIRNRAAELKPQCDAMLLQVQKLVQDHPTLCDGL